MPAGPGRGVLKQLTVPGKTGYKRSMKGEGQSNELLIGECQIQGWSSMCKALKYLGIPITQIRNTIKNTTHARDKVSKWLWIK